MNEEKFDVTELTEEEDALKDELLSVEKKDTKIRHLGMKKSIIIMSVAIVLVVALIAGYMFFGNDTEENPQTVEVLYDYEMTDITKIEIHNNVKNNDIIFTSFMNGTTQAWNVEGQKYDDVNQTRVKGIAQFASHLESKYIVEYNENTLSEYGLKNPTAIVKVTYANGETQTVNVGNEYGNGEGVYVSVEGKDKIYVVSDYARIYFTYELSALLNLPSLSKTGASAQMVSVFDAERNLTALSYTADPLYGTEAWFLISPADSETNSEAVDEFFSYVTNFTLYSYYCDEAGEDLTLYGFDKPMYELQSYSAAGDLLDHLVVGKAHDENTFYCMLLSKDDDFKTSPVYLVEKDALKTIYANPVTLANPYLLSLNINWLRNGKIVIGEDVYEITIDRQLKYDDEGNVMYNDDGSENTKNTYFINGKQLDETQFKYFYRTFLFLQIEGVVPENTERKEKVLEYELNVVIPVLNSETNIYEMHEISYTGAYHLINDTFALFESNQSENSVFTVRITSVDKVKEALNLLLEGRMPTK